MCVIRGAAIAQWIRLRLPFCCPGFNSQAHHQCLHQIIFELWCVEKTRINKKRPGLADFLKRIVRYSSLVSFWKKDEKLLKLNGKERKTERGGREISFLKTWTLVIFFYHSCLKRIPNCGVVAIASARRLTTFFLSVSLSFLLSCFLGR